MSAAPAARDDHPVDPAGVLTRGTDLHLNHYGAARLPFACVGGRGLELDMVDLSPERRGRRLRLLDASGGYASATLGGDHPVVRAALARGTGVGNVTDEVGSLERAELLDRLFGPGGLWTDHFPAGQYHVSGRSSGSEGNELALRLVLESRFDGRRLRHRPGKERRDTILAFQGAWHGWTGGLVPLLNRRHYRTGLPGTEAEGPYGVRVEHIPFGDFDALAEFFAASADRLLAVVVEPIQGDAGILAPPPGYLRELARRCTADDVLLVADEVLTFAKTGSWFAMRDADGPVPTDITVIGKFLGMGVVSTSMVIAREDLAVRASGAVSTSDLRPLNCAVIRDGIEHIEAEGLLRRSADVGVHLAKQLDTALVGRHPDVFTEVRGTGSMLGVELTAAAAGRIGALRSALVEAGVYAEFMAGAGKRSDGRRYVHPTLRIVLPLIADGTQAGEIVDRVAAGARALR
ncbi:aminotransferase class III-fold pyridoxal phosphate-dependent enzyme [Streptomyces pinistramenti]|uniref:aminotransferase class III-fold pyridoxal phosphate-dependent enzyme n=1 Tax=Streptomyces pinistramenti TaxID=2884812 RepID=UPI001D060B78|nr:aminotransferase class III-fold pyridoxal phosphate-dependent enzyme [Streptomyces pinistramenti]MCB5907485.1 aminotransferase class III-fold pyridoxal phosphate-dependent enzyme [Streptomyces pinistramenti]